MESQKDWKELSEKIFTFKMLEEIEKKDTQTLP